MTTSENIDYTEIDNPITKVIEGLSVDTWRAIRRHLASHDIIGFPQVEDVELPVYLDSENTT